MKYSEFKRIMEDKGFKISENDNVIHIVKQYAVVAKVSKTHIGAIDLNCFDYVILPIHTRQFIANNCMELAFTPIEDREEEERFKLKQKGMLEEYLMWIPASNQYVTSSKPFAKFMFTQSEIDEMPEYYTHPAVWEKIKVE